MNGIREELEGLREGSQSQRKRFLEMIVVLLRDVGDIGSILGGQMNEQKKPTIDNLDQAEEEFTLARLYLSKLKTEARTVSGRLSELESGKVDHQKGIGLKDKELDEARLLIQQHEAKMRSMLESIKELEEKKRSFEQTQDSLNEEVVKLRAQGPTDPFSASSHRSSCPSRSSGGFVFRRAETIEPTNGSDQRTTSETTEYTSRRDPRQRNSNGNIERVRDRQRSFFVVLTARLQFSAKAAIILRETLG